MFGGMVFMGVVYAYKPDTRCVDSMLVFWMLQMLMHITLWLVSNPIFLPTVINIISHQFPYSLDCLFPFLVYAQPTFDFIHYDFPLFGGNFLLNSIQSWALKEAKERLEARGEEYQYKPKSA